MKNKWRESREKVNYSPWAWTGFEIGADMFIHVKRLAWHWLRRKGEKLIPLRTAWVTSLSWERVWRIHERVDSLSLHWSWTFQHNGCMRKNRMRWVWRGMRGTF